MSELDLQLGNLKSEFERNERFRFGCYVIALLGVIWIVLLISDVNAELRRDYRTLLSSYDELAEIESTDVWIARKESQLAREEELSRLVWKSSSESITIAAVQAMVRTFASESGLLDYNLTVGTPQIVDEEAQIYRIRIRVRARFFNDDFLKFVGRVEDFSPSLNIENLEAHTRRLHGPNRAVFNADVVAYYKKGGA